MIPTSWYRPLYGLLGVLFAANAFVVLRLYYAINPVTQTHPEKPEQLGHLKVITLAYNVSRDYAIIAHNCRMVQISRHEFFIYTTDMSASYCRLCTCRPFVSVNCPNLRPGKINLCEKTAFIARMVQELGEMVYIDTDLIIMKPFFLDRLYWLSRAHDFLGTTSHKNYGTSKTYHRAFNSGLFFIRYVDLANYAELLPEMYRGKQWNDQVVLSQLVFRSYRNWDSLSWKWHCRFLLKMKQDIPVGDCYTLHDRREEKMLRAKIKHKLLTIPS